MCMCTIYSSNDVGTITYICITYVLLPNVNRVVSRTYYVRSTYDYVHAHSFVLCTRRFVN